MHTQNSKNKKKKQKMKLWSSWFCFRVYAFLLYAFQFCCKWIWRDCNIADDSKIDIVCAQFWLFSYLFSFVFIYLIFFLLRFHYILSLFCAFWCMWMQFFSGSCNTILFEVVASRSHLIVVFVYLCIALVTDLIQ